MSKAIRNGVGSMPRPAGAQAPQAPAPQPAPKSAKPAAAPQPAPRPGQIPGRSDFTQRTFTNPFRAPQPGQPNLNARSGAGLSVNGGAVTTGGFQPLSFRSAKMNRFAQGIAANYQHQPIGPSRPTWEQGHTVNQLHPQGADGNYKNGAFNCAGAAAATVARKLGTFAGVSDADLITHLSAGRTTDKGTKPEDMMSMLEDVGARPGKPMIGRFNPAKVNQALDQGQKFVAQIGVENVTHGPNKGYSDNNYAAHWVVIDGKDAHGNYRINDPLKGDYTVTPAQLQDAIWKAPGTDGMLIPFSPAVPRPVESAMTPALVPPSHPNPQAFKVHNADIMGANSNFEAYGPDKLAALPRLSAAYAQQNASFFGKGPDLTPLNPNAKRHVFMAPTPEACAAALVTMMSDKEHPTRAMMAERMAKELEGSNNAFDRNTWHAILRFVDEIGSAKHGHGIGYKSIANPY